MADKKAPGFLIPAIIFILGLCILLYPTVSDLWNQFRQNQLIGDYQEAVQQLSDEDYARAKAAAKRYNASLQVSFADAFSSTKSEASSDDEYWQLLNVAGNGVMAYVEIPKISTRLAIYHGLSDEVLQTGLGHVLGTSLPIGGNGTHCVVAGHRGLPSALLLTDLDQVVEGDRFAVYVLDEKHCYEVDQISVVDPEDISTLEIDENQDYFTFITCTPYGVNTQRLLVRGHAVEDDTQLGSVDPWQQFLTSLGWQGKLALALIALLVVALIVRALKRRNQKNAQNINKLGAFSVLLVAAVSFCVIPGQAQALTTPDLSQKGSIMLSCAYDSTPISELEASLYQVAQFKEDGSFELDDAFAATDIDLNTLSAASEWRSAATTLLKHARENKLSSSSLVSPIRAILSLVCIWFPLRRKIWTVTNTQALQFCCRCLR